MSTFKRILEAKSEISQKDMKRLQRAAAAETPEQAKEILKNLESTQDRATRTTRTVPSAKPSTVEQTPLNKYIRGEAEKGRGVSQELRDTAGIDDAERRGYIKPEKAGETKPTSGATNRARARGAAARHGVDISTPESKFKPRGRRLGDTTRGGPVKVTTLKPSKTAPPPTKTQVVKQSDVSKKADSYRRRFNRTNKRGILSREVDKILQDLRGDARGTRARMSAAVDAKRAADKNVASRANQILRQLRKPSTNASAAQPTTGFSDFTQRQMSGEFNQTYQQQKQQQPNFRAPEPSPAPTKPTPAPTKPTTSKVKVTGGTPRVTDLAPTKRPAGTKTFAQFAKSGRTAQQKQATVKALQTPPKPKTAAQPKVKVTAPPKPKAPTRAAVAPKVSKLKVAKGVAGGALSALGAVQSGYEGYSDAKKAGASDTRAWLRGAAKAAGGLIGGTLGGAGGGIVGGIAGYSIGSALADKTFTALAGATKGQKDWMKQANLASQKGTAVNKVKYKKGTQAVIYDPRTKKERIGTFDPTSGKFKAANLATSKAYTARNPFERLGRQFSRSNEGSGLFGMNIVKGGALADKLKGYYAAQDEKARAQRVSDFKKAASAK
jgi:hypothetical protein